MSQSINSTSFLVEGKPKQVISIDSSDTVVIDDAFSISKTSEGDFVLRVYITNPVGRVVIGDQDYKRGMNKFIQSFDREVAKLPVHTPKLRYTNSLSDRKKQPALRFDMTVKRNGSASLSGITRCKVKITRKLNEKSKIKDCAKGCLSIASECAGLLAHSRSVRTAIAQGQSSDSLTPKSFEVINLQMIVNEFMMLTTELISDYSIKNDLPVIYRRQGPEKKSSKYFTDYLDEPGLVHHVPLTSPLRRFADLHNILIIDAHLRGKQLDNSLALYACSEKNRLHDCAIKKKRDKKQAAILRKLTNRFIVLDSGLTESNIAMLFANINDQKDGNKIAMRVMKTAKSRKHQTNPAVIKSLIEAGITCSESVREQLIASIIKRESGLIDSVVRSFRGAGSLEWNYDQGAAKMKLGDLVIEAQCDTEDRAFSLASQALFAKRLAA